MVLIDNIDLKIQQYKNSIYNPTKWMDQKYTCNKSINEIMIKFDTL